LEISSLKPVKNITFVNIVKNYKTISVELDAQLVTRHKFESFVFYFLRRLVLINLRVEQTDVPMVFECAPSLQSCPNNKAKSCIIWPLLNNLQFKVNDFLSKLTLKDIA
jgi:hypothetical protein